MQAFNTNIQFHLPINAGTGLDNWEYTNPSRNLSHIIYETSRENYSLIHRVVHLLK